MAATGGIRAARRAGETAARIVITMPAAGLTSTVRGFTTRPVDGRSKPIAASPAFSSTASPIPAPRPAAEASIPMIRDSPRTEAITWRRLPPTARSRASSRSRWATMIEKVLKMTKDPVNSATHANTSRNTPMKLSAWWMLCWPSAMTAWPLTTWTSGVPRMAARSRLISSGWGTRGAAWMSIWLTLPGWPRTRAARAGVNAVTVAPSGLSARPQVTMPVMVYVAGCCWLRTVTLSPIRKCPTAAECLSITTWELVRGGCPPGSSRSGLSDDSPVQATPRVGAPLEVPWIGLPFLVTSWA